MPIVTYDQLFTHQGCQWVCVGGQHTGRIAVVSDETGVVELLWIDNKEPLMRKEMQWVPFVARVGQY